jgi:type IV pilus assembly protein PilM
VRFPRVFRRRFRLGPPKGVVALEFAGEWLKLAHVAVGAKGKRLVRLMARRVGSHEALARTLRELVRQGQIPTDAVLVSIPRNLVTVRNLQLPTNDLGEIREMISLQAAKQTPFAKDEIIADFQIVKSRPEGYTDVLLVTTHRSVATAWLKTLDEAHLRADGVRLGSQGVLDGYRTIRGARGDEEAGPIGVVDIDANFSDFLVILGGELSFTKALATGATRLVEASEKVIEKFTEELQRAVDIYESEGVGRKIKRLMITGGDVEVPGLITSLMGKLRIPVERMSHLDNIPDAREVVRLPAVPEGAPSLTAVRGLAWGGTGAKIDLTPPEIRIGEALADKGRALVVTGMLGIAILTALAALVWQHLYFKRQYLEQLHQEISRTQPDANEVDTDKKKIKLIRGMMKPANSALETLSVVHRSIPPDLYLRAVTFDEGAQVVLKGASPKMSSVFEFASVLEKLPNFHQVKTRQVTRSGKEGKEEAEFEIVCPLAKDEEA